MGDSSVLAMGVPASRLLLSPVLKIKLIDPSVVGVHLIVDCCPAVKLYPDEGMSNGFWKVL